MTTDEELEETPPTQGELDAQDVAAVERPPRRNHMTMPEPGPAPVEQFDPAACALMSQTLFDSAIEQLRIIVQRLVNTAGELDAQLRGARARIAELTLELDALRAPVVNVDDDSPPAT
jgi:hypothetical protein